MEPVRCTALTEAADVVAAVRGPQVPRPVIDRPWSAGLLDLLQQAVVVDQPPPAPQVVGWRTLIARGWTIPMDGVGGPGVPEGVGTRIEPAADPTTASCPPLVPLTAALFRQWCTIGQVGDPLGDALGAMQVLPGGEHVVRRVARLARSERRRLADELTDQARWLQATWPPLDARWHPIVGEELLVPVGGGAVVVRAEVDLSVGPPARARAARCFVVVTPHVPRRTDWLRLWLAALAEAVRSGAAPFQVGVLALATRSLWTQPVVPDDVCRVAGALAAHLASCVPPSVTWCADAERTAMPAGLGRLPRASWTQGAGSTRVARDRRETASRRSGRGTAAGGSVAAGFVAAGSDERAAS